MTGASQEMETDSELCSLIERCAAGLQRATSAIVAAGSLPESGAEGLSAAPDVSAHLKQMRNLTTNFCQQLHKARLHSAAAKQLKETINTDNDDLDGNIKAFKDYIESRSSDALSKNNPLMQQFNETVSNLQQNLDDSDLIQTEYIDQYIDPITKQQISCPVRNKVCNHVYEKTSISEIIKRHPTSRCPVLGCGNRKFLTMKDLPVDEALLCQLTQSQRAATDMDKFL
ncbi:E3 SUMO-protein ligase NSE2-like [Arctopsyche grandis]|uniref:E3 SUMO-protein ligase NSE2-like n=1 Tax=Arctopsyche grandis TaxID=121162 RepID=UPI00406D9447